MIYCPRRRSRPPLVVPFRDSKLTRVLQSFFCGHGRSCMLVNINPCSSTYDETLQALKFSAIATQVTPRHALSAYLFCRDVTVRFTKSDLHYSAALICETETNMHIIALLLLLSSSIWIKRLLSNKISICK